MAKIEIFNIEKKSAGVKCLLQLSTDAGEVLGRENIDVPADRPIADFVSDLQAKCRTANSTADALSVFKAQLAPYMVDGVPTISVPPDSVQATGAGDK